MTQSFPRRGLLTFQRGVSLIAAVVLLVLLAGLTAALVRVVMVQQVTSGLDAGGSQAYYAARSGLEWGIYQQLRAPAPAAACFASPQTFPMPSVPNSSLSSFTVTVTCSASAGNAVGKTTNRWTIVAVACNQPGLTGCPNANASPDYIARRVQAELN